MIRRFALRPIAPTILPTISVLLLAATFAGCKKEENPWADVVGAIGPIPTPLDPTAANATPEQLVDTARRLSNEGKVDEAGVYFEAAIKEFAKRDECSPVHFQILKEVAYLYYFKNRYLEAVGKFETVVALREKCRGPESLEVADDLQNLGNVYAFRNNFAQAEPVFLKAIAIREKAGRPDAVELGKVLSDYADMLAKANRKPESEPIRARADGILNK